jgi:hypothetical protein
MPDNDAPGIGPAVVGQNLDRIVADVVNVKILRTGRLDVRASDMCTIPGYLVAIPEAEVWRDPTIDAAGDRRHHPRAAGACRKQRDRSRKICLNLFSLK